MNAGHGAWMLDGRDAIYGMVAGVSNAIPVSVLRGTGAVSVADKGAIGDGESHPLSQVFPTLDMARKMYPFADSLKMEIDEAAIRLAISEAEASEPKKAVHLPGGRRYRVAGTLTLDQVSMFSDAIGTTIQCAELGPGKPCIQLTGQSNQMNVRPYLRDISIEGPSRPAKVGQSPADCDGIRIGRQGTKTAPQLERVFIKGFRNGIVIDQDDGHIMMFSVASTDNYYGLHLARTNGDTKMVNCQFGGNRFAGIGCRPDAGLGGGFTCYQTTFGFQPYGIYQEPGRGVNNLLTDCIIHGRFEALGNGAIVSEATIGGENPMVSGIRIVSAGFNWDDSFRIASKPRDYCLKFPFVQGINTIEMDNFPFMPGDKGLIHTGDGQGRFRLIFSGRAKPDPDWRMVVGNDYTEGLTRVSVRDTVNTVELDVPAGARSGSVRVQTNHYAASTRGINPQATPMGDPGSSWWIATAERGDLTELTIKLSAPAPSGGVRFRILVTDKD
jgi:hypothetical protein